MPVVLGTAVNPFLTARQFYANPDLAARWKELRASSGSSDPSLDARLERLATVPSAFWIDTKAKIRGRGRHDTLEGILMSAAAAATNGGAAPLCTFVWYNLPNRDCHAKASSGEFCCGGRLPDGRCDLSDQPDNCMAGLHEYMTEYADPFIEVLSHYAPAVPVVIVLEPDSLPNLITNAEDSHCRGATFEAYTRGLEYAARRLAEVVPSASVYLDAGHGGWIGWDEHAQAYMQLVCSLG